MKLQTEQIALSIDDINISMSTDRLLIESHFIVKTERAQDESMKLGALNKVKIHQSQEKTVESVGIVQLLTENRSKGGGKRFDM